MINGTKGWTVREEKRICVVWLLRETEVENGGGDRVSEAGRRIFRRKTIEEDR